MTNNGKIKPAVTTRLDGGVIVGGIGSHFGHAFVDLLDRLIHLSQNETQGYDYLAISGPILPTVHDLMTTVRPWINSKTIIDIASTHILADKVLYAENLSQKPFWSGRTLTQIKLAFQHQRPTGSIGYILFITRSGTSQRRLLNEELLIKALQQLGLELRVFAPERHSLSEQIEAFNNALIIIGPIGSGLFNAVFASRQCKLLICLAGEDYVDAVGDNVQMLRSLASNFGIPLIFANCESQGRTYDSSLFLTTPTMRQLLKEIDKALGSS